MIRWNGTHFQGYDGTSWLDLDLSPGLPTVDDITIGINTAGELEVIAELINPPSVDTGSATTVNLTVVPNTYEYYAGIDSSSNIVTVNLPAASSGNVVYYIKDIGCASSTNRIRVVVNGLDTIITTTTGNSDFIINNDGAAVKLVSSPYTESTHNSCPDICG